MKNDGPSFQKVFLQISPQLALLKQRDRFVTSLKGRTYFSIKSA